MMHRVKTYLVIVSSILILGEPWVLYAIFKLDWGISSWQYYVAVLLPLFCIGIIIGGFAENILRFYEQVYQKIRGWISK